MAHPFDEPAQRADDGRRDRRTAGVLSQSLSEVEIKLIESDEIATIGVGEATIPHIHNLIALAG